MINRKIWVVIVTVTILAAMLLSSCGSSADIEKASGDISEIGQDVVVEPDLEAIEEALAPEEPEEVAPVERTYTPMTFDWTPIA